MKRLLVPVIALCLLGLFIAGCPGGNPTARFSFSPEEPFVNQTITFENESFGGFTRSSWEFGDGNTSTDLNPTHSYRRAGTFEVRLLVADGNRSSTDTQVIVVRAEQPPEAGFSASRTLGVSPMTVTFTDETDPGSATELTYLWDFGDGGNSDTAGDVSHTFRLEEGEETAAFTITLTVTSADGQESTSRQEDLIMLEQPLDMVEIGESRFEMGLQEDVETNLTEDELEAAADELPRHNVILQASYAMGAQEITNALFARVLNNAREQGLLQFRNDFVVLASNNDVEIYLLDDPASLIDLVNNQFVPVQRVDGDGVVRDMGDYPVQNVTWEGAVLFCNWLSEMFNLPVCYNDNLQLINPVPDGFRLPTEAEWERAAGWDTALDSIILGNLETGGKWSFGNSADSLGPDEANYGAANPLGFSAEPFVSPAGFYSEQTSPAGCLDMSGNVAEWVYDRYVNSYLNDNLRTNPDGPNAGESATRVFRGGHYNSEAFDCRTTARASNAELGQAPWLGFRVARGEFTIDGATEEGEGE